MIRIHRLQFTSDFKERTFDDSEKKCLKSLSFIDFIRFFMRKLLCNSKWMALIFLGRSLYYWIVIRPYNNNNVWMIHAFKMFHFVYSFPVCICVWLYLNQWMRYQESYQMLEKNLYFHNEWVQHISTIHFVDDFSKFKDFIYLKGFNSIKNVSKSQFFL